MIKKFKVSMSVYMFVKREVSASDLLTLLVGLFASAVSLPPSNVILAELAFPPNDVVFVYICNN